MMTETFPEAAFNDLLAKLKIEDEIPDSLLTVAGEPRDLVQTGLERALIDPTAMQAYLDQLDAMQLPRPLKHNDLLPDEQMAAILQRGLICVPAEQLAALALNPLAMLDLRDAIVEDISDFWWSVATRFCRDAALIDRVVESKLDQLDAIVEPRREQGRAYESPALTVALDNPSAEPAASGPPDRSEHWNEEPSLGDAEFLAIDDAGRAGRAKATTVIVGFHLFPDRESGTLEVHLSQPLPLSGPATCSAKLLNRDERVPQNNQGEELANASTTARDGRLRFTGIGSLLSEVHWLEIEYHHPNRFHLRLCIPLRKPIS